MQLFHLGRLKISRQRIYVNYFLTMLETILLLLFLILSLGPQKHNYQNVYRAVIPRRGLSTWAEGIDSRVGPAGPTTDE